LDPIDENLKRTVVPVYDPIGPELMDRTLDIITERKGIFEK